MRLRRLDLKRYGHFTDLEIEFGAPIDGQPDLHFVLGLNEAGKSTLAAAVHDLLFGFGHKSDYAFLHGYDALQIGAHLELPSGPRDIVRVKKGQAKLRDGSGQPIDEGLLAAALSGIDRDAYEKMFALDEETLRTGGEDILASKGELGQLLFSASAGLARFSQTLNRLQEQADGFHKHRGRNTELSSFKAKLDELKAAKERINILATTYAQLVHDRDTATDQYNWALEERSRLDRRRDEIARQLQALPEIHSFRAIQNQILPLADLPEPPEDWIERVPGLLVDNAKLVAVADRLEADLKRLTGEHAEIQIDQAALDVANQIDGLSEQEARFRSASDIPARQQLLNDTEVQIRDILRKLEQPPDVDPKSLELTAGIQGKLRGLVQRRSGIAERLQTTIREQARAGEAAATAQLALDSLLSDSNDLASRPGLQALLSRARASDHTQREAVAQRYIAQGTQKLATQLAALTPWTGDIDVLIGLQVPTAGQIQEWRSRHEALQRHSSEHASKLEALTTDWLEHESRIGAIKSTTGLADDAEAAAARSARDDAWQLHRATLDPETARAFETALHTHDAITDVRIRQASDAADLRQSIRARIVASASIERATTLCDKVSSQLQLLGDEIGASLLPLGLPADMRLADLDSWLRDRDAAIQSALAVRMAESDLKTAQEDEAELIDSLTKAIDAAGKPLPLLASSATLIEHLQDIVDAAAKAALELANAKKNLDSCTASLVSRDQDLLEAQKADAEWADAWAEALNSCWLGARPHQPDPDEVSEILTLLANLPALIVRKDDLSHHIRSMTQDRADFLSAVVGLCEHLHEPAPHDPLAAAEHLRRRLDTASRDQLRSQEKAKHLEGVETALRDARNALADHKAEAATITAFFAVETLREVMDKLTLIGKRTQFRRQTDDLLDRILTATRCTTIAAAETMLDGLDQAELDLEGSALAAKIEHQDQQLREFYASRMKAENALAAVGGDDAVALLDEQRRTILVELEDSALQYARLRLGIAAAQKALQIYRDTHRTSMLQRASEAFRTITRGAYSGLATQPAGDKEILLGLSAGGGAKLATDMSTGARAQLYLALRIAGFHEFAKTRKPLPFIADDILETFDDLRAEEACRLFTDMARTGQVIVATHHHHLVAIARQACPNVTIHELPA